MSDDIRPAKPVLDANDLQTAVWRKIKEHIEAKRARACIRLEGDLDPVETSKVRGELKAYRHLLALGHPSPAPDAHEDETE